MQLLNNPYNLFNWFSSWGTKTLKEENDLLNTILTLLKVQKHQHQFIIKLFVCSTGPIYQGTF